MLTMKRLLGCCVMVWVLCLSCALAHGQALPTATGPGFFLTAGGGVSGFQVDYGKRVDGGWTAYSELHLHGRPAIVGEVRFLTLRTDEQVTEKTFLVGPQREVFRYGALRPYVKFLVGDAHMRFPFGYANGNYFVMAPGGGLDVKLSPRVSLRVVDVEYQSWPQFTFGELHPWGVSAGINVRLTRPNLFRRDPYIAEQ